jgi:hypothetical protein
MNKDVIHPNFHRRYSSQLEVVDPDLVSILLSANQNPALDLLSPSRKFREELGGIDN